MDAQHDKHRVEETDPGVSVEPIAAAAARRFRWMRWAIAGVFLILLAGLGTVRVIGREPAQDVLTQAERDVLVGEDETVEESLVVAARSVRVEGVVNGDVVVAARRVVLTGTIRGEPDRCGCRRRHRNGWSGRGRCVLRVR